METPIIAPWDRPELEFSCGEGGEVGEGVGEGLLTVDVLEVEGTTVGAGEGLVPTGGVVGITTGMVVEGMTGGTGGVVVGITIGGIVVGGV